MVNKNYRRGRRFEYEVKQYIEDRGWKAYRTAGSHGEADIIGIKDNVTLLIQCKYNIKPTKQEKEKLFNLDSDTGGNVIVTVAYKKERGNLKFFKAYKNVGSNDIQLIETGMIRYG